jgi:hypothetical protein
MFKNTKITSVFVKVRSELEYGGKNNFLFGSAWLCNNLALLEPDTDPEAIKFTKINK